MAKVFVFQRGFGAATIVADNKEEALSLLKEYEEGAFSLSFEASMSDFKEVSSTSDKGVKVYFAV